MKLFIFTAIGGALLLSGCAGTQSDFQCNATTSDTCMTMQQANEKAKLKEENTSVKPGAAALPRLADGNFSSASTAPASTTTSASAPATYPLPAPVRQTTSRNPFSGHSVVSAKPVVNTTSRGSEPVTSVMQPRVIPVSIRPLPVPEYPRPLRVGEQTARLWIAPYIDADDVYHQPSNVVFVVTPSHWGQPRIR